MIHFDKIKLIIWDMDETFWDGIISEGDVIIPEGHLILINNLTDCGIVNSICSKNDYSVVKNELEKYGIFNQFVFVSVNWKPKGNRVKHIIEDMHLRTENVLFIDDNHSNREEVRFMCPGIMIAAENEIDDLCEYAKNAEHKDPEHKRLHQYQLLEEKKNESTQFESNIDFLKHSNIRLKICHDCDAQIDRIHDLLLRANQLNFTKLRSSKDELQAMFADSSVECAYIEVSDKFGEYGIVGFYAIQNNRLIHFTFSCRTLGMGIEQYVYNHLNRPQLNKVGEVISDLSTIDLPDWINQIDNKNENAAPCTSDTDLQIKEHTVLVKGPCDLFQLYPYIPHSRSFDTEFTYTLDNGLTIESTGHTTHIVESLRLTKEQKDLIVSEVPFTDHSMYCDNIFRIPYKVVFISILTDANLGVYQRKETGEKLAFLEYIHPITDPANWDKLISKEYNTANFNFTKEILKQFAEKYEFIGRNSPEQIVENLKYIKAHLNKDCTLVIMLGGELYYEKNIFEAYKDRHIVHKKINEAIRRFAIDTDNVRLLDVNKYLVDQTSFYDHFNHYIKPVYYQLAHDMIEIINECTGESYKEKSKLKMIVIRMKEILYPYYHALRKLIGR